MSSQEEQYVCVPPRKGRKGSKLCQSYEAGIASLSCQQRSMQECHVKKAWTSLSMSMLYDITPNHALL